MYLQAPSPPGLKRHVLRVYRNRLSSPSPLPIPVEQGDRRECHVEKVSLADYSKICEWKCQAYGPAHKCGRWECDSRIDLWLLLYAESL